MKWSIKQHRKQSFVSIFKIKIRLSQFMIKVVRVIIQTIVSNTNRT